MFIFNFYKKKFKKLLLSINKILDSFFNDLEDQKVKKIKVNLLKKNSLF